MNQVKIYNAKGELREILSAEVVTTQAWEKFDRESGAGGSRMKKKGSAPKRQTLNLPERPCDGCGVMYKPSRVRNNFCNKKCQQAKYRESRKVPVAEKVCEKCGKSYMGTKARRWCNDPCSFYITKDGEHSWRGK